MHNTDVKIIESNTLGGNPAKKLSYSYPEVEATQITTIKNKSMISRTLFISPPTIQNMIDSF